MTLTLLLDLDDTLLENNMDTFLPAYLKGLSARLASLVEPGRMVKALLAATSVMSANTSPAQTLEQTFDAAFYPALDVDKETLRPLLEAYYAEDFPHLQSLTRPHPQAQALVEKALRAGFGVGIATNPLFPRTAIEQRVAWAGLAGYPFALIPSYETFHFAKPNPAFLTEFLGQMGWPEGPVLMVGDSLEHDYAAARGAGISMYWVGQNAHAAEARTDIRLQGRLNDLIAWLDSREWEDLLPNFSAPQALQANLRATPAALASLAGGISTAAWDQRPPAKGWNLTEIACHLRDAEREVNLPRLRKILSDDAPFLPGMDTDAWVSERQYASQDGPAALQAFIQARSQTLALLDALPADAWQLQARHAILGPTSLLEMAGVINRHDQIHIRQAKEALCPLP